MRLLRRDHILRPPLRRAREGMQRHAHLAGAVAHDCPVRGEGFGPERHFEGDGFGGVGGVGGKEAGVGDEV